MDDPDCDSTWEDAEEEEQEEEEEDGDGPSSAGDDDGEAGAPGDAGDAEDEDEEARPGLLQSRMTVSRNWRAMRDTCRYRHHYPDLTERDGNGDMPNLSFYRNEIRFLPNGVRPVPRTLREGYSELWGPGVLQGLPPPRHAEALGSCWPSCRDRRDGWQDTVV
ncbi:opioid growth factor receptor-like [Saccopteryx bilineata]|uniref:opioid growth factor receptor-like n=1 Tax=Saccopteryx bilineata TaxID=59482 RepID=UPI00338F3451